MKAKLLTRSIDITGDSNFTQGCKFSPDGLCVLTSTASDNILRLYNTPTITIGTINTAEETHEELLEEQLPKVIQEFPSPSEESFSSTAAAVTDWRSALSVQGGDSVRSYAWYPLMNSYQPATCAFLACCRDQPIHLLDAYNGSIRATYSPHNALDEMESPSVLSFTPDGSQIFATGFRTDRTIHKFDTQRPGKTSDILRLGKTRRSKDGQKGLVSSLSFPQQSNSVFSSRHVFAVGTYSPGSIYVYDDRMPSGERSAGVVLYGGMSVMGHGKKFGTRKRRFEDMSRTKNYHGVHGHEWNGNEMEQHKKEKQKEDEDEEDECQDIFSLAKLRWYQRRVQGGVTQLLWSKGISSNMNDGVGGGGYVGGSQNDYWLYSASRRSDAVVAFDLRMLSGDPSHPIRGVASFPRDSDTNQRLEFDLDQDGRRLFVASQDCSVKVYDTLTQKLLYTLDGFHDAVNGVSFFHQGGGGGDGSSLLAVASGARRFRNDEQGDEDSCLVKSDETNNYGHDREEDDNPPGCLSLYSIR